MAQTVFKGVRYLIPQPRRCYFHERLSVCLLVNVTKKRQELYQILSDHCLEECLSIISVLSRFK